MKSLVRGITVTLLALILVAAPLMVAHAAIPAIAPSSVPALTAPLQADEGGLTEAQLFLVGLVASAFLWVLKLVISSGYQPSKEVVAIALYVVAFGMALLFQAVTLPAFPPFADAPTFVAALLAYIGSLLELAAPVVGLAYLIYNVFLQRVLEAGLKGARKALAPATK